LKFRCPNCRRKLHIADEKAGKQAVCPSCRTSISIPAAEGTAVATCPTCGHELVRGETLCTKCLTYVGEDDEKDAAKSNAEVGEDTVEVIKVDGEPEASAPAQEEQAAPAEKADEAAAPEPEQQKEGEAAKKVLTAADKRRHVILLIVTVIVVTLSILMVLKNR